MVSSIFQLAKKKKWMISIFLLALIGGVLVMSNGHEWGDDFALYLSQAHAIIKGNTAELLQYNSWSMQHSDGTLGPFLYPQGYPLFLSIYLKFFPFNWIGIKIFQWIFYLLGAFAFYKTLSQCQFKMPHWWLLFTVALILLHPKYIQFSDRLMSDLWFLVTVFVFFYFLYTNEFAKKSKNFLIGICAILAALTRVNGFVLIISWWTYILFQKSNSKEKFTQFLWTLPFTLVVIYLKRLDSQLESNHVELLSQISFEGILRNASEYLSDLATFPISLFLPLSSSIGISEVVVSIFCGIVILFFFILAIRHKNQFGYFAPVLVWIFSNLVIIIVWPISQGPRFLIPIIPFVYWIVNLGVSQFAISKSWQNWIPVSFIFVLVIQFFATVVFFGFVEPRNEIIGATQVDMYDKIKRIVKENDVISFDKPRWLHLITNKKVIRKSSDSSFFNSQANYLLKKRIGIYSKRPEFVTDKRLDSIYGNKDYILYRRNDLLGHQ